MKNYLVVDGNWLLLNRVFTIKNDICSQQYDEDKKKSLIKSALSKGIYWGLKRIPFNNIIIASDHGSWRADMVPPTGKKVDYKKNRAFDSSIPWPAIWTAYNEFLEYCRSLGILCPNMPKIEGDDWICAFTRSINKRGDNALIWSTDHDLMQLVHSASDSEGWTAWIDNRDNLTLDKGSDKDAVGLFANEYDNALNILKQTAKNISYINPIQIILQKILAGDVSDNISPIVNTRQKNRTIHFSEKEANKLCADLSIERPGDLQERAGIVTDWISSQKRWKDVDTSMINEQLAYNRKLVELNEKYLPSDLQQVIIINTARLNDYDSSAIINNISYDPEYLAHSNTSFEF